VKKIDLGQTITILANLGVIAGIVFLAVELRQNNELLQAQSRADSNDRIIGTAVAVYENTDLARAVAKARMGQELSEAEGMLLYAHDVRRIRSFEAGFQEFQRGATESIDVPLWRAGFRSGVFDRSLLETWEQSKGVFRPDFVEWMEQNVVNR